jgi:hypothetical protein
MYQGEFRIPFGESPKFLSTTNHSIRGTDDSTNRRKYEVGISDYYGENKTPRDEFGHDLIYEWSEEEWIKSHLFAMSCVQYFLTNSLTKDEMNLHQNLKKSISETNIDFVNFILEKIYDDSIREGIEWDRKAMYQEFINISGESPDYKNFYLRTFTQWIEKFCRIFKLKHLERRANNVNRSKIVGVISEKVPTEMIKKHLKIEDNDSESVTADRDFTF